MEGVRLVRKYSRDCDLKENIDLRQKRRARELSFGDLLIKDSEVRMFMKYV